jgi:hypothetical protein
MPVFWTLVRRCNKRSLGNLDDPRAEAFAGEASRLLTLFISTDNENLLRQQVCLLATKIGRVEFPSAQFQEGYAEIGELATLISPENRFRWRLYALQRRMVNRLNSLEANRQARILRRARLMSETRIVAQDHEYARRPYEVEQELKGNGSGMLADYFRLLAEEGNPAG